MSEKLAPLRVTAFGNDALIGGQLAPVAVGNEEKQAGGDGAVGVERDGELFGGDGVAQGGARQRHEQIGRLAVGAGAAGDGDGLVEGDAFDFAAHILATTQGHEIGAVGQVAIFQHQAGHQVIAVRTALRQRDHRLDMIDQAVFGEGLAQIVERNDRLDLAQQFGRRGREAGGVGMVGGIGAALFDIGDGFGNLADDGAQHRDIGFGSFEAIAGIDIGDDVDALAEHGTGLGDGRYQARQFFDAALKPAFGPLAQDALENHDDHAKEHQRRHDGLGWRESEAKIGRSSNRDGGERDKDINQCLHGRTCDL